MPKANNTIKFSKNYVNEFGSTQFSFNTFTLDGIIGTPTEKYGRSIM